MTKTLIMIMFFRPQAKARHSSGGKDPFKVSRIENVIYKIKHLFNVG